MRILILNWRDIKSPVTGGAEILTHELAKGYIKNGNKVTQLSSSFKGGLPKETIDGVKIVRFGRWWNVHFFAFFYYLKNHNYFDLVIDEVHWFPFFAGVYARKKTLALTCEVASDLFYTLFPYPIALFFRGIENLYFYLYKSVPTMTISESTKNDLIKNGIKKNLITVLPMGLNIPKNLKKYPKEKNPTFIYLARINKQKGIYDAIKAFYEIKKSLKNSVFWIVGSGETETVKEVRVMVKELGLTSSVTLFGFVADAKKYELLAKAHILLVPSVHEGWGLTVIEAATQGTPSIAYNVPGLVNTVVDGTTGIIAKKNSPDELAKEAVELTNNAKLYNILRSNCLSLVKKNSWERTVKESLKVIKFL